MRRIEPALHDPISLHLLKSRGQHAWSQGPKSLFKILKATISVHKKFAQDQNAPAVTDNIESFGYGTVEIVFSCH